MYPAERKLATFSTVLVGFVLFFFYLTSYAQAGSEIYSVHSNAIKSEWANPELEFQSLKSSAPHTDVQARTNSLIVPGATEQIFDYWLVAYQDSDFVSQRWDIYTSKTNKQFVQRLTENSGNNIQPKLSPDATQIVFVSDRDGNPEIYVINVDGSNLRRLTNHPETDTHPAWSPDGRQIALTSTRDGNPEIYVMDSAGIGMQRLTNSPQSDLYPDWSPDGRQLVWMRVTNDTVGDIMTMDEFGNNGKTLASSLLYVRHPFWSPDNKYIAFDYDADGDDFNDIAVMDINGANLRTLFDGGNYPNATMIDSWVSGWTPDSLGVIQSGRTYNLLDLIKHTYEPGRFSPIREVCISNICPIRLDIDYGYQLGGSIRSRDNVPPTTRMKPLPDYTRGFGVKLEWESKDSGIAGVANYEAQFRTEADSVWRHFLYNYSPSQNFSGRPEADFSIEPAELIPGQAKVYFRVRARDDAENVEPWRESQEGYASTKFYLHEVSGSMTDQRGIPIPNEPVNIMPQSIETVETNLQGEFSARVSNSGEYQIDGKIRLRVNSDMNLQLYRSPGVNIIRNGTFEASKKLDSWLTQGAFTTTSTTGAIREGDYLVTSGWQCIGYCKRPLDSSMLGFSEYGTGYLLMDSKGGLHALGPIDDGYSFQYYYLAPQGHWQKMEVPNGSSLVYGYNMLMDRSDNIQIVWSVYRDFVGPIVETKYMMLNRETQQWTEPEVLPSGLTPKLLETSSGDLFITFETLDGSGTVQEIHKKLSDTRWSAPATLIQNAVTNSAAFAATSDGVLHFLWRGNPDGKGERIIYSTRSLDGTINSQDVTDSQNYFNPKLVITDDQVLHALWMSNDELFYTQRMTNTSWSKSESLLSNYDGELLKDSEGNVHLVASNYLRGGGAAKHRMKLQGKPWGKLSDIVGSDYQNIHFYRVTSNSIYADFLGTPLTLYELSESQQVNTLAQSVTVPSDMHMPTLAFAYQIDNIQNSSYFAVEIETESSKSRVFTQTQNIPWQLGWVDMSPWSGQSVTVTFVADSGAGETPIKLMLDDVSLGPWYTPLPRTASLSHLDFGVGGTIVITGENFLQSPTLFLGDTKLPDTKWINSNTIQATIPLDTPAGIYNLKVINPGGQVSYLPTTIAIGKQSYLPLIAR